MYPKGSGTEGISGVAGMHAHSGQAISLSISSKLNKFAEEPAHGLPRLVSGGSKPLLAIPSELFSSVQHVPEAGQLADIGNAMLKSGLECASPSTRKSMVSNMATPKSARIGRTLKQIGKEESLATVSV